MTADNFTNIPFTTKNLDRYIVRKSVLKAIQNYLPLFSGKLLDAGCGKMPYKKLILANSNVSAYVGLDIENAKEYDKEIKPDFVWDGRTMPFETASFDCTMATEVLEHCPEPEVFLKEVCRVLKPGGIIFFTVPFLWNLHEVPDDQYRYTPFSLERHIRNSGFTDIELHATGGWHAAMAQMMGLWVRRSRLNRYARYTLSLLFLPVMKLLLKMDARKKVLFIERSMITGLYGVARKSGKQ